MIIGYCILINPGICILWCRTTMRPARLVSYAFWYTNVVILKIQILLQKNQVTSKSQLFISLSTEEKSAENTIFDDSKKTGHKL